MTDIRLQAAQAELEAALRNGRDTSKHRTVIRQLEAEKAVAAQAVEPDIRTSRSQA